MSTVLHPPSPTLPAHAGADDAGQAGEGTAGGRLRLLLVLSLCAGVALRLLQYAVNRSIWLDEGLLLSNFLDGGWHRLLEPFHRGQTAPLGFLAMVKGAATLFGRAELVLRLPALLAGLATLLVLPRVARRFTTRTAYPFAVAIVAVSPFLVYYSSEVKPYAFDTLLSLLVLGLAHDLARRPHDRRLLAALLLTGAAGVWFSQPVVFMLAGAGTVLALRALRRNDRAALAALVGAGAAWVASFAGAYLVSRHQLEDPAYMHSFWRTGFLPLVPHQARDWAWLPRMLARVFREPMGIMGKDESAFSVVCAAGACVAFAAGCRWMWRRHRLRLALLLAPAGFALLASAARAYPFGSEFLSGGRVLVFLIPTLAFIMAEGIAALPRMLPGPAGRWAMAAAAVLSLLPAVAYAARTVPQVRAEIKPLLDYVAENRRPGDVMYVYYNGQAPFEYYAPRYGWNRSNTMAGVCARFHPERYVQQLATLRGKPRVWVLMVWGSPVPVDAPGSVMYPEDLVIVDAFEHLGRRLDRQAAVGAAIYLFDLRSENSRPFQFPVPRLKVTAAQDCRGSWEWRNQLQ